jgi:chromate transporter
MEQMLKSKKNKLGELFVSFFKISPVTFGGGYAMLPAIEQEAVTKRRWLTEAEMAEAISIAGSAPGGIGVNAAAFIGYKVMGWRGLIAAVLGMTLPTFLIVLALGIFFVNAKDNPKVVAALQGIQIAVIALIVYAGVKLMRAAILDRATCCIFLMGLGCLITLGIHPIFLIPLGIFMGVLVVKIKVSLRLVTTLEREPRPFSQPINNKTSFPEYYFGEGI